MRHKATAYPVLKSEICYVDYGSHIGEYIRQKLEATGRKQNWVAEQLGMKRQNFTKVVLEKDELSRDLLTQLRKILGKDFFEDFVKKNPDQAYPLSPEDHLENLSSPKGIYKSSGYRLHIEIDPDNFNPEKTEALSHALINALKEYQKQIDKS